MAATPPGSSTPASPRLSHPSGIAPESSAPAPAGVGTGGADRDRPREGMSGGLEFSSASASFARVVDFHAHLVPASALGLAQSRIRGTDQLSQCMARLVQDSNTDGDSEPENISCLAARLDGDRLSSDTVTQPLADPSRLVAPGARQQNHELVAAESADQVVTWQLVLEHGRHVSK